MSKLEPPSVNVGKLALEPTQPKNAKSPTRAGKPGVAEAVVVVDALVADVLSVDVGVTVKDEFEKPVLDVRVPVPDVTSVVSVAEVVSVVEAVSVVVAVSVLDETSEVVEVVVERSLVVVVIANGAATSWTLDTMMGTGLSPQVSMTVRVGVSEVSTGLVTIWVVSPAAPDRGWV